MNLLEKLKVIKSTTVKWTKTTNKKKNEWIKKKKKKTLHGIYAIVHAGNLGVSIVLWT